MSVTRSAFDAAVRAAARSGSPQPVVDSNGKTAYYVDQTGATVDAPKPNGQKYSDPVRAANPESSFGQLAGGGGLKATAAQQAAASGQDQAAKAKAQQAAAAKAQADAQQQAQVDQANGEYVWLDGHRVKVVAIGNDAAGNKQYTFATDQDGFQKTQNYTIPTAYSALDNTAPAAGTQFLMSSGLQRTSANAPILDPEDQGNGLMTQGHIGRNMMTVGNALQWLANLSVKDPGSYTAMVDKLHAAGYLGDQAYMQTGGGWSQQVASAFASAAADTAVLNSTDAKGPGYNMTLDDVLNQKAQSSADLAAKTRAANYVPVQRNMTDPEEIKAAAKNAAQAAIGRDLTPDEEAKLTGHFASLETQKYDSIDAAGRSGANTTVTDPSVPGQVQAFLDQNPQEEANYRAAQYGGALRNLFGLKG